MRSFSIVCLIILTLTSQAARADPPRTQIRGTPHLFGRDMERLVLVAPIIVNRSKPGVVYAATMMVRILPGTFIPVTEDDGGIYYQAVNGYRSIRGNRQIDGGLYVSKTEPGLIWAYEGDAQTSSKYGVEKDHLPLPAAALHNLHTGKAERAR